MGLIWGILSCIKSEEQPLIVVILKRNKKVKRVVNKIWGVIVWNLEHPSYIIEYVLVLEQTKIWGVVRPLNCSKKTI